VGCGPAEVGGDHLSRSQLEPAFVAARSRGAPDQMSAGRLAGDLLLHRRYADHPDEFLILPSRGSRRGQLT